MKIMTLQNLLRGPFAYQLFGLGSLACGVLVLISLGISLAGARYRRRVRRIRSVSEAGVLRMALETHQASCAGQLAALSQRLESLVASMQNSDEVLRDGRLNLSVRAQALQLLRAGISPEAAAVTLGAASRDMRLLAKVSRLLVLR